MKELLKKQNGITLIALVITIIVLLILAGVSIAMLTGENGILNQAQEAKEQTTYKSAEEKVNLAIMGARADDGQMTIEELKKEVEYQGGSTTSTAFPAEVEMDGYTFKVEATGKVTNKEEGGNKPTGGLTASDIANAIDKSEIYGATVKGYELPSTTVTDVGWKIFYADESNIYLIADNYVERENLPNSTNEAGVATSNKPNDGSIGYHRTAYFSNILGDYAGSSRITDSRLKALNNSYFKYLETNTQTSTNNNMKAVAYMMDTNAWNSKFKDVNNKAEYVIGGPTIELLFKSYNDKYKTAYEFQVTDATGYKIRKTANDSWEPFVSKMLDTKDSLYVINSSDDANGMWVASPSADDTDAFVGVSCYGHVGYATYSEDYSGIRPLVSLKSDVQLQKNEDGTYTIL